MEELPTLDIEKIKKKYKEPMFRLKCFFLQWRIHLFGWPHNEIMKVKKRRV